LSELIPLWKANQDKALLILPNVGTFYKRSFFCYENQEVDSELLLADKVIFNQGYATFEEGPDGFRVEKYTKNEVIGYIRGEQQWDLAEDDLEDDNDEIEFIHAETWIDLDGDGLKEPYTATIYRESGKIVCLYPRYDDDTVYVNDDDKIIKVVPVVSVTQYRLLTDHEGGPQGLG